ncbi:MAG: alpha/beta fold hydrolase [Candidatus Latescibacteria bacterium]|nr:alpha/beta fold hydrolase [Candidatus Latescibacterota bacterium]NIO55195.1 alpha/beta fold hydrolase [Candidatus Latescibacterota bacterium]
MRTSCALLIATLLLSALIENAQTGGKEEDEALPYTQEEVIFSNKEVTLAGALTLPQTPGPHPAVVLLHGSGPLNRDQEAFGMKPFWIIADHLTRKGVAVLRYDSRGVGGSSGAAYQYTISDVSDDALAAIRYLKTRNDINPHQIGLCGQSQGGAVAPLAASRSADVAFLICLAGLGLRGEEAHIVQMTSIARADGASEREIEELVEDLKRIISLIRGGTNVAEIRPVITTMLKNQLVSMSPKSEKQLSTSDEAVNSHIECVVSLYNSPWFRYFIDYDPKPALKLVDCPVLLLFGGLDTQVPMEMHSVAMVDALKEGGNDDYTLTTIPKANHQFQRALTGSPSEYMQLEKEFVAGFLQYVSDWILERVDVVN